MYLEGKLKLEGITATIIAPEMYIHDMRRNTLTIRLNPYLDLVSYTSNIDNPLNPGILNLQFTYDINKIDTTKGDTLGLLKYIVANEAIFNGFIIK